MHGLIPPMVSVVASDGGLAGGCADGGAVDAVRGLATSVLADVPRARGLVLATLVRGSMPGLRPRAATVRAFAAAARERGVPHRWWSFGRLVDTELVAALSAESVPAIDDHDPRGLACRWPDLDRTLTIPRGWIGRHLCLVVPCVSGRAPRRGPIAAALAAVADAVGGGDAPAPCDIGARVIAGAFAGITIVVDADLAVVRAQGAHRARLVPAHRLFTAHRLPAPASWLLALAQGFDGWLQHRTSGPHVRFAGSAADAPWTAAVGEPIGADGPVWPEVTARRRAGALVRAQAR